MPLSDAPEILMKTLRNYIDQHKVAIVCSARSGSTKALGTTNLLLRAASEALQRRSKPNGTPGAVTPVSRGLFGAGYEDSQSPPMSPKSRSRSSRSSSPPNFPGFTSIVPQSQPSQSVPAFSATVDLVQQEHLSAARDSVRDPDLLKELEAEIVNDCEWLRSFLFATKVCFCRLLKLSLFDYCYILPILGVL